MKKTFQIVFVWVMLVALLASCAPQATTPPAAPAEEQAATQPAASTENVTLKVWDIWTNDAETAVIDKLHTQFETDHPGVTIERTVKSFDDMKTTVKLALSSEDGPDVAQINQGESDMGALVTAGLLENLAPYKDQYGWDISEGIVYRNSFTPDGKKFGEGNLYGVAPTAELVGVYYRKDLFEELGVEVPETFAEFEDILAKAKEADYVPLVLGNLGGLAATHVYAELLNVQLAERQYLDDLIFSRGNASWETPENVWAATKLQEWVTNEYFTPDFSGISYDDMGPLYNDGQGVMMLAGSWWSSTFIAGENAANIGFFLVPPEEAGGYKLATGGTSTAYAIRANSANKELAGEYLNWMMSDQAAEYWVEAGTVPVIPVDPSLIEEGSLFADLIQSWEHMNTTDAVGHYPDWQTPTFYDTLTGALEELMGFQVTPEEFLQKLEADNQAFLKIKSER